ncbi:hypothetical protein MIND_00271500 [Mycena indigotica]|uniref:Zn(2)-C6 fungal-type domain-containing protein n=1 Tax=Mycena indigotica TaxID=2126181 RepID=A0A8H6T5Q8_9AGAR|nr:uncharacterized protein MIND_00271500 [Mycena indigotica]KAF7312575.1 hypothetical protein MIND_00271500 [Mycena indigotica]
MPAAPKSPQSRKSLAGPGVGIPKAKGGIRAKSGCYTCRIRRKKCDERMNSTGDCETCVRLRLQCLGFGAKRPDWLRESRNVVDLRDKIKLFLAAQGMIKGHAGTGPRGADQDLPILRLDEDSVTPSSSESPPTPTLSLSPSEPSRMLISSVRDQPWLSNAYGLDDTPPYHDGIHHHAEPSLYSPAAYNSNIVSQCKRPGISSRAGSPGRLLPHIQSSFGLTYHAQFEDPTFFSLDDPTPSSHMFFAAPAKSARMKEEDVMSFYIRKVVGMQFMLADPRQLDNIVLPSVTTTGPSREAATLLASLYMKRSELHSTARNAIVMKDAETKRQYQSLAKLLTAPEHSEHDALAAISIISTFLFDGGAGSWAPWLGVSYKYADSVFRAGRDPKDALFSCGESTRFIIKTAIWFDVLAAVTTGQEPMFLHYIRELFSPLQSGILMLEDPPELSMMDVMGCDNVVVWVLAEASALAVWKQKQQALGQLSIPELLQRANELEVELGVQSQPAMTRLGMSYSPNTDQNASSRALSADLFRCATRLFLRSIVSGDFPHVREVEEAVALTMEVVQEAAEEMMRGRPDSHSSVVRSTVFAFFICGALTDNAHHRQMIVRELSLNEEGPDKSKVGNSSRVKELLEGIWEQRAGTPAGQPVPWREVLAREEMLLV